MRLRQFTAMLAMTAGAGLGAALATGPAAVAVPDPIDDAWPYGGVGLPGYPGPHTFVPDSTAENVTYLHHPDLNADLNDIPPGDEWYTIHQTVTNSLFGSELHDVVTSILDPSSSIPHVGTVFDAQNLFLVPALGGVVGAPLIQNSYLDDPQLGFEDTFNMFFGTFENSYLSDSAGVKDVVGVFGLPFTLFEIPAADPGAAAADLSDGTQQLLTEFTNAFPGVETLF